MIGGHLGGLLRWFNRITGGQFMGHPKAYCGTNNSIRLPLVELVRPLSDGRTGYADSAGKFSGCPEEGNGV